MKFRKQIIKILVICFLLINCILLKSYASDNEILYIPKGNDEYGYWIQDRAYAGNSEVKYIIIEEGVFSLGNEIFSDCPNLIQVTIPRSVRSISTNIFWKENESGDIEKRTDIIIRGYKNSAAQRFAEEQGNPFVTVDEENVAISNYMFDSDLYYSLYPDLQKAIGNNPYQLRIHYYTYGVKEGRIASYLFDPKYYLQKFRDLRNAFGSNGYEDAYYHFVNYGSREGRTGSPYFNVRYYLNSYPDLKNAFVNNYTRAIEHFAVCGINEGRIASKEFNVRTYRNYYEDLKNAFGKNWKEYYKHYIICGRTEGRKCI